jgi:predicted nucleic acid-binding protein
METPTNQPFLIADSSGLISLTSITDRNYDQAVSAAQQLSTTRATILVPADVFAETVNMVGKKAGHAKAVQVARLISTTPPFAVIDSSSAVRQAALARFARLPQSVSYTDAVVMAVADEYQTPRIFGFDEAFAKNGYEIVGAETSQEAA